MDTEVLVAIVGAAQAVTLGVLGLLGARLSKVQRDASATRDQIVNHHPKTPNFRDENDKRHAETKRWFNGLWLKINSMETAFNTRLDNVESYVTELIQLGGENRDRIKSLEDTEKINDRTRP